MLRPPSGNRTSRYCRLPAPGPPANTWAVSLHANDILRWFLTDAQQRFPDSAVLFSRRLGGALHRGTIHNRLRDLQILEGQPQAVWFSHHELRRACGTHNYQRGVGSCRDPASAWPLDDDFDDALRASVGRVQALTVLGVSLSAAVHSC